MRKFLAVPFALVLSLVSCDIDPMGIEIENDEPALLDPITVRFYDGDELFHSEIIERGSDMRVPAGPEREAEAFTHWTRTTHSGEERAYGAGHALIGIPFDVSFYAMFRNAAFQHEVSDVSHSVIFLDVGSFRSDVDLIFSWTNPAVADFSHVLVEGIFVFSQELEQGADNVTFHRISSNSYPNISRRIVTLVAVDVHGNMSRGVEYMAQWEQPRPEW